MATLLSTIHLIAAESPGPRGDNPDDSGGIFIILGIALAFIVVLGLSMYRRRTRVR
jgi:hypothetical protein